MNWSLVESSNLIFSFDVDKEIDSKVHHSDPKFDRKSQGTFILTEKDF